MADPFDGLEHQSQRAVSTLPSPGRIGPEPAPPEDGLQWVGGPKVHPALFGIPLQRGERIPVPKHGFSCVLMVT